MPINAQVPYQMMRPVPRVWTATLAAHPMMAAGGLGQHPLIFVEQPAPSKPVLSEVGSPNVPGRMAKFAGKTQIYVEEDPTDYLYQVATGLAQGYRVAADGRRQIVAFYVPGDFFGFELGETHTISVESINDSNIRIMKRSAMMAVAAQDHDVALQLRFNLEYELRRDQQHILRLGKVALERVADFLLEMSRRLQNSSILALPMSRRDIADYLCLTIETVSRSLTRLRRMDAISLINVREIKIKNPIMLERLIS